MLKEFQQFLFAKIIVIVVLLQVLKTLCLILVDLVYITITTPLLNEFITH